MGLMDSLKSAAKKQGEKVMRDVMGGSGGGKAGGSDSRAPDDPEAYAAKVAEAISADVRCVCFSFYTF